MAYFGEGAASEGDFHAALNIAATRSCPVVFICRNNGFAISTPSLEQYRGDGIASRGIGYGIDTIRVDGNDFWAVREATKRARRIALGEEDGDQPSSDGSGCKPVLIEAMTYRVSHHSTSDDSFAYRARNEVDDWKRRDNPITRLRKWMDANRLWDDAREKEARETMRAEILKGFSAAEREKKSAIESMFEDIYEHPTPELMEQRMELKRLLDKYPAEYDISEHDGGVNGL